MRHVHRAATTNESGMSFESFVAEHELELKRALVAAVGLQAGLDATAEARLNAVVSSVLGDERGG